MDDRPFDDWTRSLFAAASRRSTARTLVAGTLAALLVPESRDTAAAKCKKLGKRCDRRADRCCGGARCRGRRCRCTRNTKACNNRCILKTRCCGGCPPEHSCCISEAGEACVDLSSDFLNCGECGRACPVTAVRCAFGNCL